MAQAQGDKHDLGHRAREDRVISTYLTLVLNLQMLALCLQVSDHELVLPPDSTYSCFFGINSLLYIKGFISHHCNEESNGMGHLQTSLLLRPQSQLSASHIHLFSSGTTQSPYAKYKLPFSSPAFPLSSMTSVPHLLSTTPNTQNYGVC